MNHKEQKEELDLDGTWDEIIDNYQRVYGKPETRNLDDIFKEIDNANKTM